MAQTQKEKALKIIVKQIKELDQNTLTLDILKSESKIRNARAILFDVIDSNGYFLTQDYKLVKDKS